MNLLANEIAVLGYVAHDDLWLLLAFYFILFYFILFSICKRWHHFWDKGRSNREIDSFACGEGKYY